VRGSEKQAGLGFEDLVRVRWGQGSGFKDLVRIMGEAGRVEV
jgi:hypothetical protein